MSIAQSRDTPTAKVVGVPVAAAVGGFLFGFDSSVVDGGCAPSPSELEEMMEDTNRTHETA